MPLESHAGICFRHPLAVVDDLYGRTPCILHQHVYHRRTCIDGVLHQFLDHGCRTLHDLACCNLVGNRVGKKVYDVHLSFFFAMTF